MAASSIGFGFQQWGSFPFGSSDWAEEVTWKIIPLFYKDLDANAPGDVTEPLRKLIDSIKPLLEELRFKFEQFPYLWDANKCPSSNLPQLAYTVGLVDDDSREDNYRRSRILNIAQLILNKGNDRGYEIVGSYDKFLVKITPLWASDCSPTATLSETTTITSWVTRFDLFNLDEIQCDREFTGAYDRWPNELVPEGGCRSAWLDLEFISATDTEVEDFQTVARRVTEEVLRVVPIHVRIRNLSFDGPRSSAGGWSIPVFADAQSVAGGWAISGNGLLQSSVGGWTTTLTV